MSWNRRTPSVMHARPYVAPALALTVTLLALKDQCSEDMLVPFTRAPGASRAYRRKGAGHGIPNSAIINREL
ncbi:MAG: hypothetical protein JWR80_1487 [Bradyrhizobium sp.]|nr:hypothetical protein [Bradyrhizobium sp.]